MLETLAKSTFTESDIQQYDLFINYVTENMEFKRGTDTKLALKYIRLLGFMQGEVRNKMTENQFNGMQIHDTAPTAKKRTTRRAKK